MAWINLTPEVIYAWFHIPINVYISEFKYLHVPKGEWGNLCCVLQSYFFFILYFIYLYKLNTKYNYMKYGLLELCAAKGSSEDWKRAPPAGQTMV